MKIYTIGHSNRGIEELLSLLRAYRIKLLVDVRAFPVSRKYPHFSRENIQQDLSQAGIEYLWLGKELGGYRKKSEGLGENSPNKAWETEGFRIYADYMLGD